jgi:hypothetical protein
MELELSSLLKLARRASWTEISGMDLWNVGFRREGL